MIHQNQSFPDLEYSYFWVHDSLQTCLSNMYNEKRLGANLFGHVVTVTTIHDLNFWDSHFTMGWKNLMLYAFIYLILMHISFNKTIKHSNILEISREKGDVQESEFFSQMASTNCALSLLRNNCKNFRRIYTFWNSVF